MQRQPDNELRTTVIGVKPDGKRFRAAMEDGRVQEFTLSTQGYIAPPTAGQDIIIKYNIQASNNPKWPDPTFWANEIMPAANGQSAPPMADVPPAYEQTAQRVDAANAAHEIAEPKKDVYQAEGDARNQSIEMQVCLKAAVEITNHWDGGSASQQVVEVARALHNGLFTNGTPQQEESGPPPDEEAVALAVEPNQEVGEPERQFTG